MKRFTYTSVIAVLFITALVFNFAYGQNWTSLNGPSRGTANVQDLTTGQKINTSDPTVWYEAQGSNIYISTNAGATWTATGWSGGAPLVLACSPIYPQYIIASFNLTVTRSTNSGQTWLPIITNDINVVPKRLAVSKANNLYFLLGSEKVCGGYSLKRSSNRGATWTNMDDFYSTYVTDVTAVNWHPISENVAFVGGTAGQGCTMGQLQTLILATKGVFFSTNATATSPNWYRSGSLDKNITAITSYGSGTVTVLAATADNQLYKTDDGAKESASWTQLSFSGGVISDLQIDANNNIYAAATGGVYKSTDGGSNWSVCNKYFLDQTGFTRIAIDRVNANSVLAGTSTNLYGSTDGGAAWSDASLATSTYTLSSAAVSGYNGFSLLSVSHNTPVVAGNNGTSWSRGYYPSCTNDFGANRIVFKTSTGGTALIAGHTGATGQTKASLLKSADNGSTWTEVRSGTWTPGQFNGVSVDPASSNGDRFYVYGLKENGTANNCDNISVTADGGSNWNRVSIPNNTAATVCEVVDLVVDYASHGSNNYSPNLFAAINSGGDKGVWKTTNLGNNWTKLLIGEVCALCMSPAWSTVIYAAGSIDGVPKMWKSTNGGSTWSVLNNAPSNITRIFMHPSFPTTPQYPWVIAGGRVYSSKDYGASWTDITGSTMSTPVYDLQRDISSNAYAYAATTANVYKINPIPQPPYLVGVNCYCPDGGDCGGIGLESMNFEFEVEPESEIHYCYAAPSWPASVETDVNTSGGHYRIYRSTSPNSGYGAIATVGYTTTSYIDYSVTLPNVTTYYYKVTCIDVAGQESEMSSYGSIGGGFEKTGLRSNSTNKNYQLFQNSPNPFNPVTRIEYNLPEANHVSLKLYDVLGREVATLINGYQEAGHKSVEVSANNYPSGIYYYRIQAGKFSDVKKMLLLK